MSENRWVITAVILFLSVAAVTTATLPIPVAESQPHTGTTGGVEPDGATIPEDMLPTDNRIGPVGIVNELREAHSTITDIMIDHSNMDYSRAENIVFTMTVVDYDEKKLNIILDPILLTWA